jgi:hypothetical protein
MGLTARRFGHDPLSAHDAPSEVQTSHVTERRQQRRKRPAQGKVRASPLPRPVVRAEIPRPRVTRAMEIRVVPTFPEGDPRNLAGGPQGNPGMYRVRAVLGVPGLASVLTVLDLDSLEGDTLVELPPGVTRVALPLGPAPSTPELRVWLIPNRFGRAARAEMEFPAEGFDSARKFSYDVLAPMMSRLSFDHDVALDIVATEITEVATGSRLVAATVIGRGSAWVPQEVDVRSTVACRALLSSYREGMNSLSPFLRALSFARVIEGANRLRQNRAAAVVAAGGRPSKPSEHIPSSLAELGLSGSDEPRRQMFTPFLGKKFTVGMEQLRPAIRNAVAHLDPESAAESLVADRWADVETVDKAGPVLAHMARVLLTHEISVAQGQVTGPLSQEQ